MIKLFFSGDTVITENKQIISKNFEDIIKSSHLSFCNFEGPILKEKNIQSIKSGPLIHQNSNAVKILKKAGFKILNLANNHILDYGEDSLRSTINEIKRNDLQFIGIRTPNENIYYKNYLIEGNKVSIICCGENGFGCENYLENKIGYPWLFSSKLVEKIQFLKSKNHTVILSVHAGLEMEYIPLKQFRVKYKELCNAGVDVIIGHHPHVPQGIEKHNNSLIFYSLGNFYFDYGEFKKSSDDSFSVTIKLENDKIDYDIHYHKKIDGICSIVSKEEVNFSINNLNLLLGDNYDKTHNYMVKNNYKIYKKYYRYSMGLPEKIDIYSVSKFIYNIFFNRKKYALNKSSLLIHNLLIDTNRFVVINHLKNQIKNSKKLNQFN